MIEDIKESVQAIVSAHGLELFDIEQPPTSSGVLKVFITSPTKSIGTGVTPAQVSGVSIEHCAKVNREIFQLLETKPIDWSIEVSSPGINRQLKTEAHIRAAIGERVSIFLIDTENVIIEQSTTAVKTITNKKSVPTIENARKRIEKSNHLAGALVECSDRAITVVDDDQQWSAVVPFSKIKKAHTDFKFD